LCRDRTYSGPTLGINEVLRNLPVFLVFERLEAGDSLLEREQA